MTLRLNGSTSGYTEIDAPAVAGSNTLVLPSGNGSNGQALQTNGSGALSWGPGVANDGQLCKAWVNFNGTGTVAIRASYNVSSITDNGVGNYTINFATALQDANYSWVAGQQRDVTVDASIVQLQAYSDSAQTASALQVICYAVNPSTNGPEDPRSANIAVFR